MSTSASSTSWDDEYGIAADLTPEELAEALARPNAPVARYLVAELTGVDDPSPTLIIETITALNQSQPRPVHPVASGLFQQHRPAPQVPHVSVEQHRPGVNDLAAGAVYPAVQPFRTPEELESIPQDGNDSTLCKYDFRILAEQMPYKLFGIGDLRSLNLFNAAENIQHLPTGFHTTTLGLKKVWIEVFRGQEQAVYSDEQLLRALLKVGGVPRPKGSFIVYPEDLVPCANEELWDDDHRTYWALLADLARTSWGENAAEQDGDEGVVD